MGGRARIPIGWMATWRFLTPRTSRVQRGTRRGQRSARSAEAWLWAGWVPGGAGLAAGPSSLGFSTCETGHSAGLRCLFVWHMRTRAVPVPGCGWDSTKLRPCRLCVHGGRGRPRPTRPCRPETHREWPVLWAAGWQLCRLGTLRPGRARGQPGARSVLRAGQVRQARPSACLKICLWLEGPPRVTAFPGGPCPGTQESPESWGEAVCTGAGGQPSPRRPTRTHPPSPPRMPEACFEEDVVWHSLSPPAPHSLPHWTPLHPVPPP